MASVSFEGGSEHLTAYLTGEIDHHAASLLRQKIDARAAGSNTHLLILDFGGVSFMDSSGVGLILGRQRRMQLAGGILSVQNPPPGVRRMLEIARVPYVGKERA